MKSVPAGQPLRGILWDGYNRGVIAGVITVCVVGLLGISLWWLVARSRAKIVLDATCAGCGYITTGLPGSICPECGADLSRPGAIRLPGAVRPFPLRGLIVLWTLIFGLGLVAIESVWLMRADRVSMVSVENQWGSPHSKAYRGVLLDLDVEVYRGSPIRGMGVLTLKLLGDRSAGSRLTWDVATRRGRIGDGTSMGREMAFDRNAILAWMSDNGVDSGDAEVGREADAIERDIGFFVRDAPASHLNAFSSWSSGFQRDWRATRTVLAVRVSLWVCWIVGVVWLWRRSNRAWRVALVRRVGEVETDMARMDEWDGRSLRNFE